MTTIYVDFDNTIVESNQRIIELLNEIIPDIHKNLTSGKEHLRIIYEKNVEAARKHLNEVMTERKTHERLKEKAFENFKQELQYMENKEIDELVSYSFHEGE